MRLRYLLDTNVISDPTRREPDPGIRARLDEYGAESALASVVWHEMWFGVSRLPDSRRKRDLQDYLVTVVEPSFPILPYDEAAAQWHAEERARLGAVGWVSSFTDGQIAAVAHVHGLVLVTANLSHFERFDHLETTDWRERR